MTPSHPPSHENAERRQSQRAPGPPLRRTAACLSHAPDDRPVPVASDRRPGEPKPLVTAAAAPPPADSGPAGPPRKCRTIRLGYVHTSLRAMPHLLLWHRTRKE
ncbi:hypothetical protein GCM10009864_33200 [Streptomyces lunalinharesii]|uniref:Uncharacterized protein n=1 Tax=Streptomyces lunalinharesii TaxID=333384 RepID=A0ABN3RWU9_9ACTN